MFQRYDAGRRVPVVKNIILIAEALALEVSPGTNLDLAYRYWKEESKKKKEGPLLKQ